MEYHKVNRYYGKPSLYIHNQTFDKKKNFFQCIYMYLFNKRWKLLNFLLNQKRVTNFNE